MNFNRIRYSIAVSVCIAAMHGATVDAQSISPAYSRLEPVLDSTRSDIPASYLDGGVSAWKPMTALVPDSLPQPYSSTWTEKQITFPGDGKEFGAKVAMNGTTAFVSAPNQDNLKGAVYVFLHTVCTGGVCSWGNSQKLVATDGAINDQFGASIAFDGTTLLVGATGATIGGHVAQGAIYVFQKSGTTWTQVQKLTDAAGSAQDALGSSVAVSGSDALAGAQFATLNGQQNRGAAYRYAKGTNGTWALSQKITASDGGPQEQFGTSVAIKNGTALIGALNAFQFANWGVGAVYVYTQQCFTGNVCNPNWLETQKLIGSPTSTEMAFGTSIAFDGTTALIGAEWALIGDENLPVQVTSGAVYAFGKTNGLWTQTQQLLPSDANTNWRFGASIALQGNTAVVGSVGAGWPDMKGAAYVFNRSGSTWTQAQKITASNATTNDYFGSSVDLSGSLMAIGALQGPNNTGRGTTYFYENVCTGLCGN